MHKIGQLLSYQLRQSYNCTIIEISAEQGTLCNHNYEYHITNTKTITINDGFIEFYSNPYTSQVSAGPSDIRAFFDPLGIPKISPEDQYMEEMDSKISSEEITQAINSMQNGKTPSPDGLTEEFYKTFSAKLSPFFNINILKKSTSWRNYMIIFPLYLFTSIDKFGFGSNVISSIKTIHSLRLASAHTNLVGLRYFQLEKDSYCWSPFLFDLAIEPLAVALRTDEGVRVVSRYGEIHKGSLYADNLL